MRQAADKANDMEWLYLKLSWVLVSLPVTCIMVYEGSGCPFPTGICRLYSFAPIFSIYGKPLLVGTLVVLCLLYLFEKKMLLTTFLLSLLSCIIISHHESNGIFFRATILSLIWIGQFLAYIRYHFDRTFDLLHYRIQYSVQMIAAVYTLAGIAKIRASGLGWINAGDMFPLQVMKNYAFLYFDSGSQTVWAEGKTIAYFLMKHHGFIRLFLAVSLGLELFCLAAAIGRKWLISFGVGLLLMHIGIAAIMGIGISVIGKPMVVFFLNPLYRVKQLADYFLKKKSSFVPK